MTANRVANYALQIARLMDVEEDLNLKMECLFTSTQPPKLIPQLKFRNSIILPGDDLILLQDQRDGKAKLIAIAKTPSDHFPLLLIAWYFHPEDNAPNQRQNAFLSRKQLILSDYTDWQYAQSVKGKMTVLSRQAFHQLLPRDRQKENLFFCGRTMRRGSNRGIVGGREKVCRCCEVWSPEESYRVCVGCQSMFHRNCSSSELICSSCGFLNSGEQD